MSYSFKKIYRGSLLTIAMLLGSVSTSAVHLIIQQASKINRLSKDSSKHVTQRTIAQNIAFTVSKELDKVFTNKGTSSNPFTYNFINNANVNVGSYSETPPTSSTALNFTIMQSDDTDVNLNDTSSIKELSISKEPTKKSKRGSQPKIIQQTITSSATSSAKASGGYLLQLKKIATDSNRTSVKYSILIKGYACDDGDSSSGSCSPSSIIGDYPLMVSKTRTCINTQNLSPPITNGAQLEVAADPGTNIFNLNCTCPASSGKTIQANGSCICPAGTYAASGAASCTACAAGTYSSSLGATSCTSCAAGTYASSTGSTSCNFCYTGAVTGSCTPTTNYSCADNSSLSGNNCTCNSGYYQGGSSCLACRTGAITGSCTGTTNYGCAPNSTLSGNNCTCNSGYYQSGSSCVSCYTGAVTAGSCNSCATGASLSGTTCYCNSGTYWNGSSCAACYTGAVTGTCSGTTNYSCSPNSTLNGTNCTCNNGYSLSGTSCTYLSCPAGTELRDNSCLPCILGYSWAAAGANVCSICAFGSIAGCDITTGAPTYCISGYSLSNGTCTACAPNTWAPGRNNWTECKSCLVAGAATCDSSTGNATSCVAGYSFQRNTTTFYSGPSQGTCTQISINCPANASSTSTGPATNVSGCFCNSGYAWSSKFNSCYQCPSGYSYCQGLGIMTLVYNTVAVDITDKSTATMLIGCGLCRADASSCSSTRYSAGKTYEFNPIDCDYSGSYLPGYPVPPELSKYR